MNRAKWSVQIVSMLQDNYTYILRCPSTYSTAIVDVPYGPLDKLYTALESTEFRNLHILSTHKHADHCGGNLEFKQKYTRTLIVGGKNEPIPGAEKHVAHNEVFSLGELQIRALDTPCHTHGHVCFHVYHSSDKENGCVFTGDTLFTAGVGAFFEGNAAAMLNNMKVLFTLPYHTRIYCGHEYTESFLLRARNVEPSNSEAETFEAWVKTRREKNLPTMGTFLGDEMRYNVFARCMKPEFQEKMGIKDEVLLLEKVYAMTRRK